MAVPQERVAEAELHEYIPLNSLIAEFREDITFWLGVVEDMTLAQELSYGNTLVNVYVELVVFTRIAGTS